MRKRHPEPPRYREGTTVRIKLPDGFMVTGVMERNRLADHDFEAVKVPMDWPTPQVQPLEFSP